MEAVTKQNTELKTFLKNIEKGLKHYSLAELNTAIIQFLNKKGTKHEEKHWHNFR